MDVRGDILTGDCLTILDSIPPASVDLVFCDPPFNIGLHYPGYDDNKPDESYLRWLDACCAATITRLSPTGTFWLAMTPRYQAMAHFILKGRGLHWRNTVVWCYEFGPNQWKKFTPCWVALMYFVKDPARFTWNADAIKVPSARQTKYGDKRAKAGGKVPTDVWPFPRVCGTFKARVGHVCQMPLAPLQRIVLACSNKGDLVLDPMCGPGTTCLAAALEDRHFCGIELCPETADLARQRIAQELEKGGTS